MAIAVLVDVEPDTYQIDIDRIEPLITAQTRAMLVPNLVGGMPDWDRLRAIADKHGLKIIEDSADTLGGTFRGTPAGTRSDISITSFSIFHIITCLGNGGLVAVNDPALWDRGLMLRAWGRSSEKYLYGSRQHESDGRKLQVHLEEVGIFTRVIFSGHVALQPMMQQADYRLDPAGYPNAERVMRHGLMLPCHPTMTSEDCQYLYQVLDDFIEQQPT